eukprot:gene19778-44095_t
MRGRKGRRGRAAAAGAPRARSPRAAATRVCLELGALVGTGKRATPAL